MFLFVKRFLDGCIFDEILNLFMYMLSVLWLKNVYEIKFVVNKIVL